MCQVCDRTLALRYCVIYYEKFRKVMQRTEKVALSLYLVN